MNRQRFISHFFLLKRGTKVVASTVMGYCLMVIVLTSCDFNTVYDKYDHTPIAGWEKNDTLTFDVPRMAHAGIYREELGLRINDAYPFMRLHLIVEQRLIPGERTRLDTLNCYLIDEDGNIRGQGVSYYQYTFPITQMQLQEGDSLHISIRHDMKREILPGIADIGIKLTRR